MSTRERAPNPLDLADSDKTLRERLFLLWDFAIVGLVSINLGLILFDLLFSIGPVANALHAVWPAGHDWYQRVIHARFMAIDLAFVAVFVTDVIAGWTLAVIEQRYHRWFFYPFARWYDVLGCIPVAGFRFLRVLRVISILMRLQRLGVIDIRNWAIYRTAMVYYDIVVEEISDRVVIKVLAGAQDELNSGGQNVTQRVLTEVIAPRRERLVRSSAIQLENMIIEVYQNNRAEIQAYVAGIVNRSVEHNAALKNLERVPMLGSFVSQALDQAISDTVNNVLDEAVQSLSSEDFETLVQRVADNVVARLLDPDSAPASEIRDVVIEVLDLVKEQVAVKRWHEHFE